MHDSLRLIRDDANNPIEVLDSLTDISDRNAMEEALRRQTEQQQQQLIARLQHAQEQLLQSEKMASLGQFAAGIAHAINNPMGFVNANMSSLRNYVATLIVLVDSFEQAVAHLSDDSRVPAKIERLKQQADPAFLRGDAVDLVTESLDGLNRVREIVQSLKDFSRLGRLNRDAADLHVGLDSTLNIVNSEIKYRADVHKEYGTLPKITCIAAQLNQVFMNLLMNAAQAVKEHGVITIRTGTRSNSNDSRSGAQGVPVSGGAAVDIRAVLDSECAADDAHASTPAAAAHNWVWVEGSDTGAGLSPSYGIVSKHGGHIDVASTVGEGTRFTVHLPMQPPQANAPAAVWRRAAAARRWLTAPDLYIRAPT